MAAKLRGLKAMLLLLLAFAMVPVGLASIIVVAATYEHAQASIDAELLA